MKKRAMFIGRWQPLHRGHEWLISQKLDEGIPCLIAVRDIPPDDKNPLTAEQVKKVLLKRYEENDVQVMVIPDIESINWGRGVGYQTNEHQPPTNIGYVSATEIRSKHSSGDDSWRDVVDPKVQDLVLEFLNKI